MVMMMMIMMMMRMMMVMMMMMMMLSALPTHWIPFYQGDFSRGSPVFWRPDHQLCRMGIHCRFLKNKRSPKASKFLWLLLSCWNLGLADYFIRQALTPMNETTTMAAAAAEETTMAPATEAPAAAAAAGGRKKLDKKEKKQRKEVWILKSCRSYVWFMSCDDLWWFTFYD